MIYKFVSELLESYYMHVRNFLVGSKMQLQPKQIHRSNQKGRPRINTAGVSVLVLCERFADAIKQALVGNFVHDAINTTAMDTFGKSSPLQNTESSDDWILTQEHKKHCLVWRLMFGPFPIQQWSKTGKRTCSHTLWHLLPAAVAHLQGHALKEWWQPVQPCRYAFKQNPKRRLSWSKRCFQMMLHWYHIRKDCRG